MILRFVIPIDMLVVVKWRFMIASIILMLISINEVNSR